MMSSLMRTQVDRQRSGRIEDLGAIAQPFEPDATDLDFKRVGEAFF